MFKDRKVTTIIVAAGRGSRFGGSLPKQFMKIDGMTVLEKAILPFQDHPAVDRIIWSSAEGYAEASKKRKKWLKAEKQGRIQLEPALTMYVKDWFWYMMGQGHLLHLQL